MEDISEANVNKLKSMLLDEEQLITYVSLSKDLCVHVNNSKFLLLRVLDVVRRERPDLLLNVNYIISGAMDGNNARTIICSEQDLDDQRKCFINIFFEHVYSVCKGRPNKDMAAYSTVNKFQDLTLCAGLIKNKLCNKWTSLEIENLKSNSQEIAAPEKSKSLPLAKIKQETNSCKNIFTKDLSKQKDNESKSEPIIKKEQISPKKDSTDSNHIKEDIPKPNGHRSQKGIAGFFNKASSIKNTNQGNDKVLNGNNVIIEPEKKYIKEEKMEVEEEKQNEKLDKNKEKTNKNLSQIKKNAKVDKKRKRVLHVSDSDSENENNDPFIDNSVTEQVESNTFESDDEIPPTPTTDNISIKSGIVNPKKRRKIIDKTYTDEDGYVLTKKEEIYESCSDNEEESKVQAKPPQPKQIKTEISPKAKTMGSKKKVSPPQKGKQSTLTNFFKKI